MSAELHEPQEVDEAVHLSLVEANPFHAEAPPSTPAGWQPLDLTDPEYAVPTEPPIVCGLIYRGKRHAITGPPEAAKTLAALIFGLEWARAGHGRFALVDFEMGAPATRLLLSDLGATAAEIAAIYYVSPDGPPTPDDIAAMLAAGVTLVIVDAAAGAYDASGLDDNKRQDVERFAHVWVRPLWQHGCTTVVLDHVVKNGENRGRFAIGSERKLGGVDVQLGLEAVVQLHRGATGVIRVTTHKDRPGHLGRPNPAELYLVSDPDTHRITWDWREPTDTADQEDGAKLAPAARKLLHALEALNAVDADEAAVTGQQLVEWIAKPDNYGHGLKRETVSRHLNALARTGHVRCANPDAPFLVEKLWLRVTDKRSRVTDHTDTSRVTSVTNPLRGVTRSRSHTTDASAAANHDHADSDDIDFTS